MRYKCSDCETLYTLRIYMEVLVMLEACPVCGCDREMQKVAVMEQSVFD